MDVNNPIPLIYQSGYLTIKDYDREFQNYLLDFPNDEVRYGFMNFLVPFYTPMKNNDQGFYIGKFIQELELVIMKLSSPVSKPSSQVFPMS